MGAQLTPGPRYTVSPTPTHTPTIVPDGVLTLLAERVGTHSISVTLAGESRNVEITSDEPSMGSRVIMSVDIVPLDLAQAAFVTLSEDDALRAAMPSGFRIAGSESVVEITLHDSQGNRITALEAAGTVCLPVDAELLSDTREQTLKLLHYDVEEGWVELHGSEVRSEDDVMLVCADAMRFSPFVVGYANQAPEPASVTSSATAPPIAEQSAAPTPMPAPMSLKATPIPPTAAPTKQAPAEQSMPVAPEPARTAEPEVSPMQQQSSDPVATPEAPSAPGSSDGATVVSEETSGSRVWLIAILAAMGALAVAGAGAVAYPRLRRR